MVDFDLTQSLRGKAILVPLAVTTPVKTDGEPIRWQRVQDPSGEGDAIATFGLRLDANVLAEIEDQWGSVPQWLVESQRKTWKTVRDTFAICLEREPKDIGVALLESMMDDYVRALGAAYAIANGLDPTVAVTVLAEVTGDSEASVAAAAEQINQMVTPGRTGLPRGSGSKDPSTSSGD